MSALAIATLLTAFTMLITLGVAFAVAKSNHVYLGGLAWPFISDLGRDPPGSYVLFFGLNIASILLGLTWSFNLEYQSRFLQQSFEYGQISHAVCFLSYISCIFGVVGAFGLPIFVSFDASPSLKYNSALIFLLCEILAMFIHTYLNYRILLIKRSEMDSGVFITNRYGLRTVGRIKLTELYALKRSFLLELSCVALNSMGVVLYFFVKSEAQHLTIAKCIALRLGENYCSSTMRLNDVDTKIWDYEKDLAVHQVRALGQLGCFLALIGYILSFLANKEQEVIKDKDHREATITCYQHSASKAATRKSRQSHKSSTRNSISTSNSISEPSNSTREQFYPYLI